MSLKIRLKNKFYKTFLRIYLFSLKILRTFANDMKKKNNNIKPSLIQFSIEKAVANFYKVDINDVYKKGKMSYPINGAKAALIWIMYANGIKSYTISSLFGMTERQFFKIAAATCLALKEDTKLKEDIDSINQKLKNK